VAIFEEWGVAVVGAAELAPDLLPPAGVPTRAAPADAHRDEARRAEAVVAAMGQTDSGQACVIAGGRTIAREGRAGTDAMLRGLGPRPAPPGTTRPEAAGLIWPIDIASEAVADAAAWLSGDTAAGLPAKGGILFKAPKPGQERRVDLPVIGPATVAGAARAGLAGIVIEAGDRDGLFLWVRPQGG
jgi:DUF1009 family protein